MKQAGARAPGSGFRGLDARAGAWPGDAGSQAAEGEGGEPMRLPGCLASTASCSGIDPSRRGVARRPLVFVHHRGTPLCARARPAEADAGDAAAVAACNAQLASLLDDAEAALAKAPYLAGSEYSMADVMLVPVIYRTGLVVSVHAWLWPA